MPSRPDSEKEPQKDVTAESSKLLGLLFAAIREALNKAPPVKDNKVGGQPVKKEQVE